MYRWRVSLEKWSGWSSLLLRMKLSFLYFVGLSYFNIYQIWQYIPNKLKNTKTIITISHLSHLSDTNLIHKQFKQCTRSWTSFSKTWLPTRLFCHPVFQRAYQQKVIFQPGFNRPKQYKGEMRHRRHLYICIPLSMR